MRRRFWGWRRDTESLEASAFGESVAAALNEIQETEDFYSRKAAGQKGMSRNITSFTALCYVVATVTFAISLLGLAATIQSIFASALPGVAVHLPPLRHETDLGIAALAVGILASQLARARDFEAAWVRYETARVAIFALRSSVSFELKALRDLDPAGKSKGEAISLARDALHRTHEVVAAERAAWGGHVKSHLSALRGLVSRTPASTGSEGGHDE